MTRVQRREPDLPPGPARDLVDLLGRLRRARPRTLSQIKGQTGLSTSYISEVLHGRKAPRPAAAEKIALALGAGKEVAQRALRLAEALAELNQHDRARRKLREWHRWRPRHRWWWLVLAAAAAGAIIIVVIIVPVGRRVPPTAGGPTPGKPVASKQIDLLTYYSPSGYMGDIGDITKAEDPGNHLVRMTYEARGRGPHEWYYKYKDGGKINPQPCRFAGIMLLDGDWGQTAGAGYDLRGKTMISWEARSRSGNVFVKFLAGGVNWVWDEKAGAQVAAKYPESLPDLQLGEPELTGQWQSFKYPLVKNVRAADLQAVIAPFGWIISLDSNEGDHGQSRTFFVIEVRNIRYE